MSLLPLRRPVLSRTTYLILFACYIGIFLNLAFYRQVFPLLPVNSLHNWLVFLSMPIVVNLRDEYPHHPRLVPEAGPAGD